MASSTGSHEKKKAKLKRKEASLRRLIASGATREKLLDAALAVRDARVRAQSANQYQQGRVNFEDRTLRLKFDRQLTALQSITPEAVLAEFLTE
jgi:hypothetical protein